MPEMLSPRSAELVLRVEIEALTEVLGPRKGERFLRVMVSKLAKEQSFAEVLKLRPAASNEEDCEARRNAAAWLKAWMPTWLAKLQ